MKFTTTATTLVTTVYKLVFISLLALVASSTFAQTFVSSDISLDLLSSTGAVMGDVDGDGDLDIYVTNAGGEDPGQNKLWINDGDGNFEADDIAGDLGYAYGAAMGDVDGDSDLDIYVAAVYGEQNRLWINDGSGNFSSSNITDDLGDSRGAVMGDVDGDSDLDIYVANGGTDQNKLWINNGSGAFVADDISGDLGDSRGAVMGDVDGDSDLDIYVVNYGGEGEQNMLWINDGSGNFTSDNIFDDGARSAGAAMGDVDGDNDLDIYVANEGDPSKLWINDGSGSFTPFDILDDDGQSTGVVMGDVEGDSDVDFYVTQNSGQNKLWINDGSGGFTAIEISGDVGTSYGAAMGDVNGDDLLDIYVANYYEEQNRLWIQDAPSYTVQFLDHDSTVLDTQTVTSGDDAVAPTAPTRSGYTFTGWSPSVLTNITADTDFTAQYTAVNRSGGSSTSIPDRVDNLFDRGDDNEAVDIIEKRPRYFTTYFDAVEELATLQRQLDDLLTEYNSRTGRAFVSALILGTRDLEVNDTGSDVELLQRFLMAKGHNIEAGVTGYFGSQTKSALIKFQSDRSIAPAQGYYGPITRAAITKLYTNVVWR